MDRSAVWFTGIHWAKRSINSCIHTIIANILGSYGAIYLQMAFYESILASPHRTLNGEEADFFFVPVLDACIITRADDAPHLSMEVQKHACMGCGFSCHFVQ